MRLWGVPSARAGRGAYPVLPSAEVPLPFVGVSAPPERSAHRPGPRLLPFGRLPRGRGSHGPASPGGVGTARQG